MNNLTLILLVLALCALFPTNTQATNSLSEKFSKCEKDFWFKNLSHYKQSLKSKCLKEKHHHKKEKRHRQHHLCNKSHHHDKKVILSKWNKFSNCRCESALEELKDIKESKVLTCYQIAKFNKVTGKFIGQLTVYKKKSDNHKYDVAVKFSDIKLLNNNKDNWSKTKGGYYRSKQSTEICNDEYSIETHIIRGKISKKESMNKVSLNRISPLDIKLFDKDSEKSITLSKDQQVSIPFPNFVLNDENKLEPNPKDSKNPQDPKKSPSADNPTSPSPDNQVKPPSPNNQVNPNPPSDSNPPSGLNPPSGSNPSDSNPSDSNPPTTPSSPTENGPQDDTGASPDKVENSDANSSGTSTASNSNTKSPSNVASSNQEATVQQSNGAFVGIAVFSVIIAVGAAFVGYNTYERIKWRRHFRRGQAAAAQLNPSLANVPDYNGYGRAY